MKKPLFEKTLNNTTKSEWVNEILFCAIRQMLLFLLSLKKCMIFVGCFQVINPSPCLLGIFCNLFIINETHAFKLWSWWLLAALKTLWPRQNNRYFAEDISNAFLEWKSWYFYSNLTMFMFLMVQLTRSQPLLQAPSHYLNHYWPRCPNPHGISRPQWVKHAYWMNVLLQPISSLVGSVTSSVYWCCQVL